MKIVTARPGATFEQAVDEYRADKELRKAIGRARQALRDEQARELTRDLDSLYHLQGD